MASVMWKSDSPNGNNRNRQNHRQITIEKHDKHRQNQQKSSFSKVARILSPFIFTLNHFAVPKMNEHDPSSQTRSNEFFMLSIAAAN